MTTSLNYNFVKNEFEKKKYKLLSTEYKDTKSKLDYICPKGHEWSINWSNFKQGKGCPQCANKRNADKRRLSIEKIRPLFEKKGYTLLSTEYKDSQSKLEYICPKKHIGSIRWSDFNHGRGCPQCAGNQKFSIEKIRPLFEKRKYKLISTEYKDARSKLKYICPEGHEWSISWGHFNSGNGCLKCADKRNADKRRLSIEKIRPSFEKKGYTLISTEYKDSHSKLEYICPKGHQGKINWNNFNHGKGCPKCADKRNADKRRLSIEKIRPLFEKRKYKLISNEYKNNESKLNYICPFGHIGSISWSSFKKGIGCPKCSQSRSEKLSREILEEIMGQPFPSIRPNFLKNPNTGSNLELDGYCENLKLAFEYQGGQHYKFIPYWHKTRERFEEQQERDEMKYKMCVKKGITLILIPYKFNCYKPEELRQYIKDQLITHGYLFYV